MTTTETIKDTPIESHAVHSSRLMKHAQEQLAKGDRLQASEKAWGAVAHKVKEIAEARGWTYDTHQHFFGLAEKIAKETDNPDETNTLFDVAHGLHKNYYADSIPVKTLERQLGSTHRLLTILNRPSLVSSSRPKQSKSQARTSS